MGGLSTPLDEKLGTVVGRSRKQEKAIEHQEKEAAAAAAKQAEYIRAQEVQEKQRLAEATSEVEEKKARAKKAGGRSLLVKTSPRGISTLGGN